VLAWLVLALTLWQADGTVTVCHATASRTTPYLRLELPAGQAQGHRTHPDDLLDPPKGRCPEVATTPTPTSTPTATPTRTPTPSPTATPGTPGTPTATVVRFPNTGGRP